MRVYDFGESNSRFYLVMEYIEGKTIGSLIADQGPVPPSTAAQLVRQIAFGLEHIHRKGLIHRDVNPYNILVTRDGTAKLADLGLAIDLSEEARVTRDGATVGTFDYVAPEQARHSHAADIRSDIYSLGCSLYHMISGNVPFPSASLTEKLFSHQALMPTPLSQLVPGLTDGLAEVVRRMMEKSPDARYPTPVLVAQALEPYCREFVKTSADEDTVRVRRKLPSEQVPAGGRTKQTQASGSEPDRDSRKTDVVPAVVVSSLSTAVASDHAKSAPNASPATSDDNVGRAATAFRTPDDGSVETEAVGPFVLNLGPELSLRGNMSPPTPRIIADSRVATAIKLALRRWPARYWLWGAAALILTVTTVVVLTLATRTWLRNSTAKSANGSVTNRSAAHTVDAAPPSSPNTDQQQSTPDTNADIVVRTEDGGEIPANNLFDAMTSVMGKRSWVELRNRSAIKLTCGQETPCLDFVSGYGRIAIRAARGMTPTIEVDMQGTAPLLKTGSSVPLELSGLTFVVHYTKTGATPSAAPPPLIEAAGRSTKIDRCAFRVVGGPRLQDSHAIVTSGSELYVDHCWFRRVRQCHRCRCLWRSLRSDPANDVRAGLSINISIDFSAVSTNRTIRLGSEAPGQYGSGPKIQEPNKSIDPRSHHARRSRIARPVRWPDHDPPSDRGIPLRRPGRCSPGLDTW